jgi:SpoIIAA-like
VKHRSSWQRMALVTDKDWVRHGASALGWLAPGELRLFEPSERGKPAPGSSRPRPPRGQSQSATKRRSRHQAAATCRASVPV